MEMENLSTKVESFIKDQSVDVKDALIESMNAQQAKKFSQDIVNARKNLGSPDNKAINQAIFEIESKYELSHGTILSWAESTLSHREDGFMDEASYYAKPKDERGREMLICLDSAKNASTPAEFEAYKKMMAPIILKYKNIMPPEYVSGAEDNLKQNGFSEKDFLAIDSQNPSQILKLVFGDHREEAAKHVAEWFSVDWPKYTTEKDIDNSVADCARFITNKYTLEFGMQNAMKDALNQDLKRSFSISVYKAEKDAPNDPDKAKKSMQSSLTKEFENYYKSHYAS